MTLWYSAEYYFDLDIFDHRDLFLGISHVWQALTHIKPYLSKQRLGAIKCDIPTGAYLIHPELISIGEGTVIESGAYIKGPCVIGKGCQIRHGAYIRENVIIGDYAVIGHATELKHAIVFDHACAAHFAFVGDSILGNKVNLGAGVKCANLRLDDTPVILRYRDERLSTGLRKFGSIIGDGSQIGCNVVANPGTLLGKYTQCSPTLNIGGVIAPRSILRASGSSFVYRENEPDLALHDVKMNTAE